MKINCPGGSALCEMTTVYGRSSGIAVHALAAVSNALRAQNGENLEAEVRIDMPEYMFKSRLHQIQKELKETCEEHQIRLRHVFATKHAGVHLCAVTVSGVAYCSDGGQDSGNRKDGSREVGGRNDGSQNQESSTCTCGDVVLLGWPGMDGMLRIADEKESELRARFANTFFNQIRGYGRCLFADEMLRAVQLAGKERPRLLGPVYQIGEGGIFAALWDLAKETECGLDLDLKKIRLLQETVEVCEMYRLNPYQLISTGAFLSLSSDGEFLAEQLRSEGYAAEYIGRLTDNNDKILRNGEEIRFLDRPVPDEIFRIYKEKSEQDS